MNVGCSSGIHASETVEHAHTRRSRRGANVLRISAPRVREGSQRERVSLGRAPG